MIRLKGGSVLGNCEEKKGNLVNKKKQMLATLRGGTGLGWNRLNVALR
jgi:hypothetical protein